MQKRFMNIQEASEYLGFSTHTIYSWTSQRRIPFTKIGGRLRFDKERLDDWIAQFEFEALEPGQATERG